VGNLPHGPREERDSVHAKGVGTEKSENGIVSSALILNFMSVTQHYITASVFVILFWRSALGVIVTIIVSCNGGKKYSHPHSISKVTSSGI
jgi:hypothetical protein